LKDGPRGNSFVSKTPLAGIPFGKSRYPAPVATQARGRREGRGKRAPAARSRKTGLAGIGKRDRRPARTPSRPALRHRTRTKLRRFSCGGERPRSNAEPRTTPCGEKTTAADGRAQGSNEACNLEVRQRAALRAETTRRATRAFAAAPVRFERERREESWKSCAARHRFAPAVDTGAGRSAGGGAPAPRYASTGWRASSRVRATRPHRTGTGPGCCAPGRAPAAPRFRVFALLEWSPAPARRLPGAG